MISGLIILYIVFGFFTLCLLTFGIVILVLWNRRKLVITKFLNDTGQWEETTWKSNEINKDFIYQSQPYKYDIKKCTRDKINRPVAHYYKGNPEQQQFDYTLGNTKLKIGTSEISGKDFHVLMLSKVLKDIFTDDEVVMWFIIILCVNIACAIILGVMIYKHNPDCTLSIQSLDAINRLIRPNAVSLIK